VTGGRREAADVDCVCAEVAQQGSGAAGGEAAAVEVRRGLAIRVSTAAAGDAECAAAFAYSHSAVLVGCKGVDGRDAAEVGAGQDPAARGVGGEVAGVGAAGGPIAQEDAVGGGWGVGKQLRAGERVGALIDGDGSAGTAVCVNGGDVGGTASEICIHDTAPRAS
jgi:hypothetical protein